MSTEAKTLIGIGIATLLIVVGAVFFVGGSSSSSKPKPKISDSQMKLLIKSDSHAMIAKDAKVTLVEFGDFQCPACGASYPIVTQLLSNYNGKINFVFRNFPLPMHQNAQIAAEAAEAAGAQGKFFDMYNALYQNQSDWGESNKPMDYLDKYAKTIGLDMNKFDSDVKGNKYKSKIDNDMNDGNALSINATPTFFLNGEKIEGGLPYNQFKQKVDSALASAK